MIKYTASNNVIDGAQIAIFLLKLAVCIAEADAEERAKALNMMRMLANRQNSRWLEAKEWDMPYTFDATKFPTLLGMLCMAHHAALTCCLLCSCCWASGADRAIGPCLGLQTPLGKTWWSAVLGLCWAQLCLLGCAVLLIVCDQGLCCLNARQNNSNN